MAVKIDADATIEMVGMCSKHHDAVPLNSQRDRT
jgi:hypothetical protein